MKKILILGANSAIAKAAARQWAARQNHQLFLVGRDPNKLAALATDLKVKGNPDIHTLAADLIDTSCHESIISSAISQLGGLDLVLIAHGQLGDQKSAEASWTETQAILEVNFLSPASLLTVLANYFESKKSGHIAVITSVAGDRGRAQNYVYGTAKGALSIFLSGLRNRLCRANVLVTDLRLGFVDTPMTAHYKKGALWASPETAASGIIAAVDSGRDVSYLPWFWCWIMLVIRNIPEKVFKRMRI
jgi:decaprenylphospho-beta-D-erythro-pentofuranosid-2-ulose 2-reductase